MDKLKVNLKPLVVGVAVVIVLLLLADLNNRMAELQRLTGQKERAAAQVTDLYQTQVVLETRIAQATSEAAVYEWAYEDGRYVQPGDNPVVVLPGGGAPPTPTPLPAPASEPLQSWEIWLALFFDTNETAP
jgi:cell division protein FtsB